MCIENTVEKRRNSPLFHNILLPFVRFSMLNRAHRSDHILVYLISLGRDKQEVI